MFRMLRTIVLVGAAVGVAQGGLLLGVRVVGAGTLWRRLVDAVDVSRRARDRSVQERRRASRQREEARRRGVDQAGSRRRKDHRQGEDGEYEKALKDFKNAAKLNPELYQAYNGMGYAYRKTGDYAKALEMYDQAIKLAPGFFPEAVEYRAEAYLALNRIDDARQAYLDLFAADRKQADILMEAMKNWVASRRPTPAGVAPGAIAGLREVDRRARRDRQGRRGSWRSRARHAGW